MLVPTSRPTTARCWPTASLKTGGARRESYLLAEAFAAYELTDKATVRLNVRNLFDKKYLRTVQFGAIYGSPRSLALSLEYEL